MAYDGESRNDKTPLITADMLLPDVVEKYPATRAVLDKYGLKGCGGPTGPREPVAWFARLHGVPLKLLLQELNEVARGEQTPIRFAPSLADMIYQPFFASAAAIAVVFGALWGAVMLSLMGITGGMQFAVPYGWLLAHGQAMLFGFVVLMAMGFAYQALPRFKHAELSLPHLALASLPLMLVGLTLQIIAHFFVPPPIFQADNITAPNWALVIGSLGAVLQWLSVTAFIAVITQTLKRASKPESYDPLIFAALGWLWLSALANVVLFVYWGTVTDTQTFVQRIGAWNAPLRDAQMFGFAAQLILGVSLRFLPHAYGFREPPHRWAKGLLLGANAFTVLTVFAFPLYLPYRQHGWLALYWVGLAGWLGLTVGHIVLMGLFSAPQEHDRALKFVRAAFLWAVAGLLMVLLMPLYHTVTGQSFSHNYFAAYRHAILAGFVLLMIVGVSSKVTPILAGMDLRETNPLWVAFALLNLGNLGRIVGQTLMDINQWAGVLAATSGFVQWAGIVLWADDLWRTIAVGRRIAREGATLGEEPTDITPQTKVAAVLERYPQTLDVFLRHGFSPLANPVLRKTMARVVTIEQACRREGVDMEAILSDLRKAAGIDKSDADSAQEKPSAFPTVGKPAMPENFTERLIWGALESCYDPEIPDANIVDLGLVYSARYDAQSGIAEIVMTLTSPHCPIGDYIVEQVKQSVGSIPGVKEVRVNLTFEPPWSLERIKPEVRQRLGLE